MDYKKVNWITETTIVDIETGELITKEQLKREYNQIKITQKFKKDGNTVKREILKECEKSKQTKLF